MNAASLTTSFTMYCHPAMWIALVFLQLLLTPDTTHGWKNFHNGRGRGGMLGAPKVPPHVLLPPDQWFDQQLDHFNPTDMRTWKQRYFTNNTFFKPGGPVFLMIGGEGEASPKWMVEGAWIDYAKHYSALCFQLEHRFYGKSHPTVDLSVKNLVYLSSEQALADLAYFIEAMTLKHQIPTSKWIVFGGSYPGSLAAWARMKYPHLVHGAMSASGPLLAEIDFKEYYGVVQDSLSTYSEECVKVISEATQQIETLITSIKPGIKFLEEVFRLCDPIDVTNKNDISNFYQTLAENFAGIVQYNKDNRDFEGAKGTNITIDAVCQIMTNVHYGTAVERYARINTLLLSAYEEKCLNYTYDKMIKSVQEVSWNSSAEVGGRQWTYQTCTEFGFFQTSSLEGQPFGDKFPAEFFIQQCVDIFGPKYDSTLLRSATTRTNTLYGAYNLEVERVVFVHGSIDPWHALGIRKSLSPRAPAIYINGTAHCANMYPESPSDPPELVAARKQIMALIGEWLQE